MAVSDFAVYRTAMDKYDVGKFIHSNHLKINVLFCFAPENPDEGYIYGTVTKNGTVL